MSPISRRLARPHPLGGRLDGPHAVLDLLVAGRPRRRSDELLDQLQVEPAPEQQPGDCQGGLVPRALPRPVAGQEGRRCEVPDGVFQGLRVRGGRRPLLVPDVPLALGVVLSDALAELGEDHREVIVLHHLEGLGWDEVARRMGRTAGAVRMLIGDICSSA